MPGDQPFTTTLLKTLAALGLLLTAGISFPAFAANETCAPRDFAFASQPAAQQATPAPIREPIPGLGLVAANEPSRLPALPALPVVLDRMAKSGASIYPLGNQAGLDGYLVVSGERFQAFYVTPSGHILGGTLFDPEGKELTSASVRSTPIASRIFPQQQEIPPTEVKKSGDIVADLKTSSWTGVGKKGGKVVWSIIDVNCGYSVEAVSKLTQAMTAQNIELRLVPVAIMKPESLYQGADLLVSPGPLEAWSQRRLRSDAATVSPAAVDGVRGNQQLFNAYAFKGTPVLVGSGPNGEPDVEVGLPPDLAPFLNRIR